MRPCHTGLFQKSAKTNPRQCSQLVQMGTSVNHCFLKTNLLFFELFFRKICVKVNSEAELLEIEAMAQALNLVNYVVADAGRTQIGAGSLTVLAIGPASKPELDQITGHLKLL